MKLSRDQMNIICRQIDKSDVTTQTLKDDLLDHLCCVIENKIDGGKSFEAALQEALLELAPNGLDKIQRETFLLLHSPKIIFMKKFMYSVGLISATALSLGWMFTTLHWAGGYQLFNYGFVGFLLVFIPMMAINHYKVTLRKTTIEKLRIILGAVSGLIIGFSLVFKILHLQGADLLLITGGLMFTFGFLPSLFFNMYKKAVS